MSDDGKTWAERARACLNRYDNATEAQLILRAVADGVLSTDVDREALCLALADARRLRDVAQAQILEVKSERDWARSQRDSAIVDLDKHVADARSSGAFLERAYATAQAKLSDEQRAHATTTAERDAAVKELHDVHALLGRDYLRRLRVQAEDVDLHEAALGMVDP